MRPVCSYTDFFVLATGQNARQTKAIWDEVHERLKHEEDALPRSVAGEREGQWILADYLDVVLHVFTPEAREYYRLEELWGDVPSIELASATAELQSARTGGRRSAGRAFVWQPKGHGFEPRRLHLSRRLAPPANAAERVGALSQRSTARSRADRGPPRGRRDGPARRRDGRGRRRPRARGAGDLPGRAGGRGRGRPVRAP